MSNTKSSVNLTYSNQKHGSIIPIAGDVTSKPDLERIAAQIQSEAGHINLLVCNAGIMGPTFSPGISVQPADPKKSSLEDLQRDLWSVDPSALDKVFSINVGGVFFTIAAFLPLLNAGNENGGSPNSQVVVTSSIGGLNRVPMAHYLYSASKAAVTHMAKQFASTCASFGIRFNVIAPGCAWPPLFSCLSLCFADHLTRSVPF